MDSPAASPTAYSSVVDFPESFAFGTLPVTHKSELQDNLTRQKQLVCYPTEKSACLPVSSMTGIVSPPNVILLMYSAFWVFTMGTEPLPVLTLLPVTSLLWYRREYGTVRTSKGSLMAKTHCTTSRMAKERITTKEKKAKVKESGEKECKGATGALNVVGYESITSQLVIEAVK